MEAMMVVTKVVAKWEAVRAVVVAEVAKVEAGEVEVRVAEA